MKPPINPEGQRLRKAGGSTGTTYFAPDVRGALMAEYNGVWVDYVRLNGRLIGRMSGGQAYAVHVDQVGRPEEVTDSSRAVVWRAENYPFNQNVTLANITLNLGFPGQYYDAETRTWNNGYRDYISKFGRYLESDPVGLAGGNTYAYVHNAPIRRADPLGLDDTQCMYNPSVCGMQSILSDGPGPSGGSYMGAGATLGLAAGAAGGALIVANIAGFPEVEIGEAAIAAIGIEGIANIEFMDAVAGEPIASLVVGRIMGAGLGTIVGGLIGYIADPANTLKRPCPH